MTGKQNQSIDLRDALSKHLNARSLSKSISTLLQSKRKTIDYSPYYQRNYVWDNDKATFFIESILLGIEIPPLIMFIPANDKNKYEVIDGRQRFETLKRFFECEFKLTEKGLRSLSGLKGKNFSNLETEIQQIFLDTTIRIIEFSTIGEHSMQNELEDRIKKEIFWRYNSGITPLKTLEVKSAKHLEDDFTQIIKTEFSTDPIWLKQFKKIFFTKNTSNDLKDAECQEKIRELLVLEHFPINIYATSGRRDTFEWLYDLYIENADNQDQILNSFIQKILLLNTLFEVLKQPEQLIYQGIYWALTILEQNDVDIGIFFDKKTADNMAKAISKSISLFTGDDKGFTKTTIERFKFLAELFNKELTKKELEAVDFSEYLKNRIERKKDGQSSTDIANSNNMRLNRPDAVTKTIEDLIADMGRNKFMIRPAYQRQEVINIKKASGIIESMLLGIPLPTIFIFRRKNGTCEVVDGQQRLLSILGFMDTPYKDIEENEAWSKKKNYKLYRNITVLKEIGGKKYNELNKEYRDRILDFELSVVYIDEKLNEEFDPIDLFIRLNNKPYPVKDHSFEMWNSYAERSIIEKIKTINETHGSWFYFRVDNKRMDNEELLTIFAYLSFQWRFNNNAIFDAVDIYNSQTKSLTFRLSKQSITEWLSPEEIQKNTNKHNEILNSISKVEEFILKVKVLTESLEPISKNDDLSQSFNRFLGVKGKVRLQRPFYMLWFLLWSIDKSIIDKRASILAKEIMAFFANNQSLPKDNLLFSVKDIFKENVEDFWAKFNANGQSDR